MKKHLIIFGLFALLIVLLTAILLKETPTEIPAPAQTMIHVDGPSNQTATVSVEIADTNAEQEQGLMFRNKLDPATGMIFIFSQAQPLSFWMKNTKIPLDILFFDAQGVFVSRTTMAPCTAPDDACPTYLSIGPSQFALEVGANEPATKNIGEGWSLETSGLK